MQKLNYKHTLWEPAFFSTPVLVGGDLTDVESNQSRQFVLLNKQKFV